MARKKGKEKPYNGIIVAEVGIQDSDEVLARIPLAPVHVDPIDEDHAQITDLTTGATATVGYSRRYGNGFDRIFLAENKVQITRHTL